MPETIVRDFDQPDELRTPPNAKVAVVSLGTNKAARLTLAPGWRWSESIKPIVGTDWCQVRHVGVLASGHLHVVTADGTTTAIAAGTPYLIEPGHDAWVEGDETVVAYEFESAAAASYATS